MLMLVPFIPRPMTLPLCTKTQPTGVSSDLRASSACVSRLADDGSRWLNTFFFLGDGCYHFNGSPHKGLMVWAILDHRIQYAGHGF